MSDEHIATVISGHTFTIDSRYVLSESKILGKGSFGVVCTAYDSVRRTDIAVKRIRPYANDEWDARHCLREIRLMKLLGVHPNVISLFELSLYEAKTELYMYIEIMDCDLHKVIQSKQALTEKHHKCFIKQILEGIKAMHSIGCFHRDLKPGNILVSKDCSLRITDFGLARFMDDVTLSGNNDANPMTEYVVTRWYRPPELLLSPNRPYSAAIDLWSIGCILAELIKRKPLFPGKSHANQVQLMFEVMGYTHNQQLGFPVSAEAHAFLEKRCKYPKKALERVLPDATSEAVQMMKALLTVDPNKRPDAATALDHAYLADAETLYDYDEVDLQRPSPDYFSFEREKYSVDTMKDMIHQEVGLSSSTAYKRVQAKKSRSKESIHSNSTAAVGSQPSSDTSPLEQRSREGSSGKGSGKSNKSSSGSGTSKSSGGNVANAQKQNTPVPGNAIQNSNKNATSGVTNSAATAVRAAAASSGNSASSNNNNKDYRRLSNVDETHRRTSSDEHQEYYDETDGPVSQLQTQMRNMGGIAPGGGGGGAGQRNFGHLSARTDEDTTGSGVAAPAPPPVVVIHRRADDEDPHGDDEMDQLQQIEQQQQHSRAQQMAAALARSKQSAISENPYRSNSAPIARKPPSSAGSVKQPLAASALHGSASAVGYTSSSSSSSVTAQDLVSRQQQQQDPQYTSRSESGGEQPQKNDEGGLLHIEDSDGLIVPGSSAAGLLNAGTGNILTAIRHSVVEGSSLGSSGKMRKAPKTPSPAKMDEILHKDMMNKKRFLLLQQQGQLQQQQLLQQQEEDYRSRSADGYEDEIDDYEHSSYEEMQAHLHQQHSLPVMHQTPAAAPKNRIVFPRTNPLVSVNNPASSGMAGLGVYGTNNPGGRMQQQQQPAGGASRKGGIISKLHNTYQNMAKGGNNASSSGGSSSNSNLVTSGSNVINQQQQQPAVAGNRIFRGQQY